MEIGFVALILTSRLKMRIKNRGGIEKILYDKMRNRFTLAAMCLSYPSIADEKNEKGTFVHKSGPIIE